MILTMLIVGTTNISTQETTSTKSTAMQQSITYKKLLTKTNLKKIYYEL